MKICGRGTIFISMHKFISYKSLKLTTLETTINRLCMYGIYMELRKHVRNEICLCCHKNLFSYRANYFMNLFPWFLHVIEYCTMTQNGCIWLRTGGLQVSISWFFQVCVFLIIFNLVRFWQI